MILLVILTDCLFIKIISIKALQLQFVMNWKVLLPEKKIITHSSIAAKLFFEKRGYRTVREQIVVRNGISLANFIMEKSIDSGF